MGVDLLLDGVISNITDKPFDLDFAVTYRCNLRCIQCNVWRQYLEHPERVKDELSRDEIRKIFTSYGGFKVLGITGGEPYMREDLKEILKIIIETQRKLKYLFITTNGTLTDRIMKTLKEILDGMLDARCDLHLIQLVSIDGPEEIHDYIRGVKGTYKKAVKTISLLNDLTDYYEKLSIGTVTVCSPFNIDKFDVVLGEIEKLRDEYHLEPSFCVWFSGQLYKNIGEAGDLDVIGFRNKLIDYIPRIKDVVEVKDSPITRGRGIFYDLLKEWLKNPTKQVVPCGAARVRYFLDAYGDVYPCTIYNMVIGNLREYNYSFKKLIDSEDRKRVRRLVVEERCPICCNTCETIPAILANPLHAAYKLVMGRIKSQ